MSALGAGGLNFRALQAVQDALLAAAAAPPSSKVTLPVAKEAAARGQMAALSARQRVDARVYEAGNLVRIRFDGPGSRVAARRALLHLEGAVPRMLQHVIAETVRQMRPK